MFHLCFLFSFHQVAQAQDVTKVYSIDGLYDVIQQIVDNSDNGLSDVDPYGFHITVKVAVKQQGQLVNIVNPSVIQSIVESKISDAAPTSCACDVNNSCPSEKSKKTHLLFSELKIKILFNASNNKFLDTVKKTSDFSTLSTKLL